MPASTSEQTIGLYGSNFVSGAYLVFSSPAGASIQSTASKLTFISTNQINYNINNDNDVGTWQVKVINPDTKESNSISFNVYSVSTPTPTFTPVSGSISIGQRIMAVQEGCKVRDSNLSELFTQKAGVHGTIVGGPSVAMLNGTYYTWWRISWDSTPPLYKDVNCWSADVAITIAPSGDIVKPDLTGYSYTTNNPFHPNFSPYSVGGYLIQEGNCTWYAFGRMLQLGKSKTTLMAFAIGNAITWKPQAVGISGVTISTTPSVHSIAYSSAGTYGHVAVVESINLDGSITITESLYIESNDQTSVSNIKWRHRTCASNEFAYYISVQ